MQQNIHIIRLKLKHEMSISIVKQRCGSVDSNMDIERCGRDTERAKTPTDRSTESQRIRRDHPKGFRRVLY